MIAILLFTNPAPVERIPRKDTPAMKAFSDGYLVIRLEEHCDYTYLGYKHRLYGHSSTSSQITLDDNAMRHTIRRNDAKVSWKALMIQAD